MYSRRRIEIEMHRALSLSLSLHTYMYHISVNEKQCAERHKWHKNVEIQQLAIVQKGPFFTL